MKGLLSTFLASLLLAGCSVSEGMTTAEAQVPEFHRQLDSGKFDNIYSSSSQDLKDATPRQDFVSLLEAISRKLGKVKSSNRVTWRTNYSTAGAFVILTYKTDFDSGSADEQFVYRLDHGAARLAGYHINSMALVTR